MGMEKRLTMAKEKFSVIGLMSGTSLDGLDMVCCEFEGGGSWRYHIVMAETRPYPAVWKKKLAKAHLLDAEALMQLHGAYGTWLGEACRAFVERHRLKPDFIASHGHTVYHQPAKGFTFQLGEGNAIHAATGIPVVYDFRSLDVMLGGEGAPLVPAGDRLLFHDFDVCLNLGGIANLSVDVKGVRKAFDICFCNMAFNYLAAMRGKSMDKNGTMARRGEVNRRMLGRLRKVYASMEKKRPSLGREIFEKRLLPVLNEEAIPLQDRMRTCVESTAMEIMNAIRPLAKGPRVLCTGGGAFHAFLISRMLEHGGDDATLIIGEDDVVMFKEALIFAFLGVLRVKGEVNVLKSVTQARRDCSAGVMVGF